MKQFIATAVLISLYGVANAGPSASEVTSSVVDVASSYARAVACQASEIVPTDVVALSQYTSWEDRDDAEYLVFWVGDIGCLGGSMTATLNVTTVVISTGDSYVVDLERSSPSVTVDASSGSKIVGNAAGTIFMETYEYADGDANCCPSITKRVALTRDSSGNWSE